MGHIVEGLGFPQVVWSLIVKVPLKELGGGVTGQSGVFRRLVWRFSAGGLKPGRHFRGFHLVQVRR